MLLILGVVVLTRAYTLYNAFNFYDVFIDENSLYIRKGDDEIPIPFFNIEKVYQKKFLAKSKYITIELKDAGILPSKIIFMGGNNFWSIRKNSGSIDL